MDTQFLTMLKGVTPEEIVLINSVTNDMNDNAQRQFISLYQSKRKDPETILILTVIGFFFVAGIQRFVLGQVGMGILYFFTFGLCAIGTIVDIVNHKQMTQEFNQKQAYEAAAMVNVMNKKAF